MKYNKSTKAHLTVGNDKTLNEREFSSMMAKFVNEGFKVWLGGATKKKKKWWEEHMH